MDGMTRVPADSHLPAKIAEAVEEVLRDTDKKPVAWLMGRDFWVAFCNCPICKETRFLATDELTDFGDPKVKYQNTMLGIPVIDSVYVQLDSAFLMAADCTIMKHLKLETANV